MLSRLVLSLGLIGGQVTASSAQAPADGFVPLWSIFLSTCGSILADPAAALVSQDRLPGYPLAAWQTNPDGTDIQVSHYSGSLERVVSFHLISSERGYNLFCDAHDFSAPPADPEGRAAPIRALFEQSPDMSITGGLVETLPGSSPEVLNGEQELFHSYVITGAFPDFEHATAQLHVEVHGLALTLFTSWVIE